MGSNPELTTTIVIPTLNAGQDLCALLDSLEKQTLKPSQIIVVDSGSTDETVSMALSRGCKVMEIQRSEFGHGRTRNLAISQVETEFAVLLTQDIVAVNEDLIAELVAPICANPKVAICYGRQLPKPDANSLEKFTRLFNYPEESNSKGIDDISSMGLRAFFCSNSCSAIRCSVFKQLNCFEHDVVINEDMLFAAKAILDGYLVYYAAEAQVYHSHPYSLRQRFSRFFDVGTFFAENSWILRKAGLGTYGKAMFTAGVKRFWGERRPFWILALLADSIMKAFAYKAGWYYMRFSMIKWRLRSKANQP